MMLERERGLVLLPTQRSACSTVLGHVCYATSSHLKHHRCASMKRLIDTQGFDTHPLTSSSWLEAHWSEMFANHRKNACGRNGWALIFSACWLHYKLSPTLPRSIYCSCLHPANQCKWADASSHYFFLQPIFLNHSIPRYGSKQQRKKIRSVSHVQQETPPQLELFSAFPLLLKFFRCRLPSLTDSDTCLWRHDVMYLLWQQPYFTISLRRWRSLWLPSSSPFGQIFLFIFPTTLRELPREWKKADARRSNSRVIYVYVLNDAHSCCRHDYDAFHQKRHNHPFCVHLHLTCHLGNFQSYLDL